MSLDEIIEVLGGDAAVARLCGCAQSAVSQWRSRGLPPRRCIELARLARSQGVHLCLDDLPIDEMSKIGAR